MEWEIADRNNAGGYTYSERWLGNLDSNQDKQSQSLLCYRYTIPQRIRELIQDFR